MSVDSSTVGLIGVGAMGGRMARNLLERGFELVICDTAPERTRALEGPGVAVVATPREVAERARRVITMLPSLEAIEQVVLGEDGLAAGAGEGSVLIERRRWAARRACGERSRRRSRTDCDGPRRR